MKISALLCTRNRAAALEPTLRAMRVALQAVADHAELVIVDNGSSDTTPTILREFAATADFPVQLVHEAQAGLSRARNAGLKAAQGEWLAFTDDDCRPEPDYYQQLMAYVGVHPEPALLGGRVELADSADQPYCILTRRQARHWHKTGTTVDYSLPTALIGANMVLHRDLARILGPFDVRFGAGAPFKGGEEIDYVYRTYLAGLPIVYRPELVVHHAHGRRTLEEIGKLCRNYDFGDGALFAKYATRCPALLRPLWWDFKKAVNELKGGPKCRPELGISHWSRLYNMARGMAAYATTRN